MPGNSSAHPYTVWRLFLWAPIIASQKQYLCCLYPGMPQQTDAEVRPLILRPLSPRPPANLSPSFPNIPVCLSLSVDEIKFMHLDTSMQ